MTKKLFVKSMYSKHLIIVPFMNIIIRLLIHYKVRSGESGLKQRLSDELSIDW